jgi:hypothetical protein
VKIHRLATASPEIRGSLTVPPAPGGSPARSRAQADPRVIGHDAKIAGQGQLAPSTRGRAAPRRSSGTASPPAWQTAARRGRIPAPRRGSSRDALEIGSRAEVASPDRTTRHRPSPSRAPRAVAGRRPAHAWGVDRRRVDRQDADAVVVRREVNPRRAHNSPPDRKAPTRPTTGGS